MALPNVLILNPDVLANRPAASIAGRLFYATDTKTLCHDNGSSWDNWGSVAGAVSTKSANYTVTASDVGTLFIANAASIVFTLPAPATAGAGFRITIKNNNQTTTSVKTNTTGVTIDRVDCSVTGATTGLTTSDGAMTLVTDGTSWFTVATDGGSGGGGSSTLAGDTDVSISSPASGDHLIYNGSAWQNKALSSSSLWLASDVSIPTAGTYVDVLSGSFVAGTWLIQGTIEIACSVANYVECKFWDGTTVYGGGEFLNSAGTGGQSVPFVARVVLGSTTTLKLSATVNAGTGTAQSAATARGFGHFVTGWIAQQIA